MRKKMPILVTQARLEFKVCKRKI